MMRSKYGSTVRVLPGRNDVSRMTPLKNGTVDYCLCGIASYFAAEGVFLFAAPEWGPQPIRAVLQAVGDYGLGVAVAADADLAEDFLKSILQLFRRCVLRGSYAMTMFPMIVKSSNLCADQGSSP